MLAGNSLKNKYKWLINIRKLSTEELMLLNYGVEENS